ncbi:hypothetical protein [Microcoleus sp. T3_A4]|uniref:hypothetical protein n=1 Tax=Microcoleus sp. T3_A4 TaxID=2818968 RepID=UPI002FD5AE2E
MIGSALKPGRLIRHTFRTMKLDGNASNSSKVMWVGTMLGLIPDDFLSANFQLFSPPLSQFYGNDFYGKQHILLAVSPQINRHNYPKLALAISHRRELNLHKSNG